MPYGVIYLLTNTVNGKLYIGRTVNVKRRQADYRRAETRSASRPIAKAIAKYGWANFSFDVVAEAENAEHLAQLEFAWTVVLMSNRRKYGYNRTAGDGPFNDEARRNMSEAQKRNPVRYWLGRKRPDQTELNQAKAACRPPKRWREAR